MYQPTPQTTTPTTTTTTSQSQPLLTPTPPPRPSSHQSGPITHHWNDLPPSLLQKPYSASASRSTSPNPQTPQPQPQTPQPSPPDSETLLEPLIEKLFSAQSTIPDAQRRQLKEKVLKAAPGMSDGQRGEVVEILLRWDGGGGEEGGKKEGREAVVGFMVRERGVAGWAMCLRRGFEGLV